MELPSILLPPAPNAGLRDLMAQTFREIPLFEPEELLEADRAYDEQMMAALSADAPFRRVANSPGGGGDARGGDDAETKLNYLERSLALSARCFGMSKPPSAAQVAAAGRAAHAAATSHARAATQAMFRQPVARLWQKQEHAAAGAVSPSSDVSATLSLILDVQQRILEEQQDMAKSQAELAARMARIEDHLQAQTHNMLAEDAIKGAMRNYQYEHETTGRTKASA